MKLSAAEAQKFTQKLPDFIKAVLLYGVDEGQMRERAKQIIKQVIDDTNDPFRFTAIHANDTSHDSIAEIAAAITTPALMGGKRVVRVDAATDKLTPLFKEILPTLIAADCLVVILAGELAKKSTLRQFFENEKEIAALACYEDDVRTITVIVRQSLQELGISLSRDAEQYLIENLGTDRMMVRAELEKLSLYAGAQKKLELEDVLACISRVRSLAVEDIGYAALERNPSHALQSFEQALLEGTAEIGIIRLIQNLISRLLEVKAQQGAGIAPTVAVKKLSPPLFFKREAQFLALVKKYSENQLLALQGQLVALELFCKQDSTLAEIRLRHWLVTLSV